MSEAVRLERCAEVAGALMTVIPKIFEGKADPDRLAEALPGISRIRAVVEAGIDGIDDERFLAWLRVAPANIAALEDALLAGDADAAFAALRDPDRGVYLLASGCEGCPGW